METSVACLLQLKKILAVNCTQSNLEKLRVNFARCKDFLPGMPIADYDLLESKIYAITQPSNSWKESRLYFKEATAVFHRVIDNALICLKTNFPDDDKGCHPGTPLFTVYTTHQ